MSSASPKINNMQFDNVDFVFN